MGLCFLEIPHAWKRLGPASVLPSASSPFGRERWDLLTDWLPFRDGCSVNPWPTMSRKPSDEDNKWCPGPRRGGEAEWLMNPCILLLHSTSWLPQGLNHSLRATPWPGCSCCLLARVRGTQWGPGWKWVRGFSFGQDFWIGWWPWLHLETRHSTFLLSRGSRSSL